MDQSVSYLKIMLTFFPLPTPNSASLSLSPSPNPPAPHIALGPTVRGYNLVNMATLS